ncbi:MAG TPA: PEGA domain-containing protein [Methanocorpusculum sp.]|nr:PEGA domain-containing protein [Methanocorpusculum sp.]
MIKTRVQSNTRKNIRIPAVIIAGLVILLAIASAACLTTTPAPAPTPAPAANTTPVSAEPVVTGSLQVNGEPGYTVYIDGTRIGQMESPTQTFTGIQPGYHDVTVEQFGVTGSTQVFIEPEKTASVSIGLSKNQILVRMAKVLNWTRY